MKSNGETDKVIEERGDEQINPFPEIAL